jgi:hypothetical protein
MPVTGVLRGPHSHGAKYSLDQALEKGVEGLRTAAITMAILLVTAGIQTFVVVVSGSVAQWVTPSQRRPVSEGRTARRPRSQWCGIFETWLSDSQCGLGSRRSLRFIPSTS